MSPCNLMLPKMSIHIKRYVYTFIKYLQKLWGIGCTKVIDFLYSDIHRDASSSSLVGSLIKVIVILITLHKVEIKLRKQDS